MPKVAMLPKRERSKKRKRTPNKTQDDDSINILMYLYKHNNNKFQRRQCQADQYTYKKIKVMHVILTNIGKIERNHPTLDDTLTSDT